MNAKQRFYFSLVGVACVAFPFLGFMWFLASRPSVDSPAKPLDCAAVCAPRHVLAGPGGSCNCAPDDAWLDEMNERCGPVPYDMSMTLDGAFTYHCGRPDKMWSTWKSTQKSNPKRSPEG